MLMFAHSFLIRSVAVLVFQSGERTRGKLDAEPEKTPRIVISDEDANRRRLREEFQNVYVLLQNVDVMGVRGATRRILERR